MYEMIRGYSYMDKSMDELSANTDETKQDIDIETNKRGIDVENVVREAEDGSLDVDWDTIEKKYHEHAGRRRHHRHRDETENKDASLPDKPKKKHKKLMWFGLYCLHPCLHQSIY